MPDMTETETTQLQIERLGAGGDGIAGKMFVTGAMAGETVLVCDSGDPKRPHLFAIIEPSPDRVTPPCPYFGDCGGCALQFMTPQAIGAWKTDVVAQALFMRSIDIPVEPAFPIAPGDRRRFVLKAVKINGELKLGFNRRGSHDVVAIDHCLLVSPSLNALLPVLARSLKTLLPEKAWAKIHATDTPVGADIWVEASQGAEGLGLARISRLLALPELSRLSWNGLLIGEKTKPRITIDGLLIDPPPRAFLQASRCGEEQLIAFARHHAGQAKSVIDLFCGVGTFALPLARRAKVSAYDSEKPAIAALERAARTNEGLKPISAIHRDLFRAPLTPEELDKADVVVIDPPRAGCEAQARHLAQSRVGSVIAISCDPGTFARDARILLDGGFVLDHVQVIDQFVWSPHIELAAYFSRPASGKKSRKI